MVNHCIAARDQVDKIEARDLRQWGRGVPTPGRVVGDRRGEAGVAHEGEFAERLVAVRKREEIIRRKEKGRAIKKAVSFK